MALHKKQAVLDFSLDMTQTDLIISQISGQKRPSWSRQSIQNVIYHANK